MKEVTVTNVKVPSAEELSMKVFNKAIEILGGPKKVIMYKKLTWVASLFESALVIVLKEVFNKTTDEIAQELGIATTTVRNILKAEPDKALEHLEKRIQEETTDEENVHIAGGLAKKAFEEVKGELGV
ncbi:regulatory domain protein [bacterium]|nr:regulatory domain protein [bacterium]